MAPQQENTEKPAVEEAKPEKKPSIINPKIFLFGLPLFILQLIVVYFVTANILLSKISSETPAELPDSTHVKKTEDTVKTETKANAADLGRYIYLVEDIIVNPADTDGKRLLLTSIGLDLEKEEMKNELKNKEVLVKDVIISAFSSKFLSQLNSIAYKDTLRNEVANRLKELFPAVKVNNVYFSKYIIQ